MSSGDRIEVQHLPASLLQVLPAGEAAPEIEVPAESASLASARDAFEARGEILLPGASGVSQD